MGRILGALIVLLFAMNSFAGPPDASIEQRVEAVLSRMTLEETLGQMSQSTSLATPVMSRNRIKGLGGGASL